MSEEERPRRDPRASRANVRRPGGVPQTDVATPAPVRGRKDPRAERANLGRREASPPVAPIAPAAEAPQRLRRDPRDRSRARQDAIATAGPADAVLRLDNPAGYVMAVLDLDAGDLSRADRDLLGAARMLADGLDGAVIAVACTAQAAPRFDAGAAGIDRLLWLADARLADGFAARKVDGVVAALAVHPPRHILFSDTAAGGELGRRVAARLGERPAVGAVRLAPGAVTCLDNGGGNETTGTPPRVIILRLESFDAVAATLRREARPIAAPAFGTEIGIEDRGVLPIEAAAIPLREADLIVSAGNGVSDWAGFHRLASALGAAEGGSRVAVDAGHLPRSRQIGASGTLVVPRCYIALGISGASQHLDGIVDCRRVVAVNVDPHADIMKRADLAIVGDVQAIMPALARRARMTP